MSAVAESNVASSTRRLARLNLHEFFRELSRWSGPRGELTERGCGYTLNVEDADGVDAELAVAALDAGLLAVTASPAMVCLEPLASTDPPPSIELRWIRSDAEVADFVAVSDRAYQSLGMPEGVIEDMVMSPGRLLEPHLHAVVAYDEGRPVAAAQLLLSHGIGGVYYVGTVEEARGQGLGEVVTRAVTDRRFELGAAFVSLQATPMGEPIYRRMGYVEIGRYAGLVRFV